MTLVCFFLSMDGCGDQDLGFPQFPLMPYYKPSPERSELADSVSRDENACNTCEKHSAPCDRLCQGGSGSV